VLQNKALYDGPAPVLLHLGMIIVGPSEVDLDGAPYRSRHVAQIAAKLAA